MDVCYILSLEIRDVTESICHLLSIEDVIRFSIRVAVLVKLSVALVEICSRKWLSKDAERDRCHRVEGRPANCGHAIGVGFSYE